jgi:hypothetical protein
VKKPRGRNLDDILAERRARRLTRLRAIALGLLGIIAVALVVRRVLELRRNPTYAQLRTIVVPLDNRTGDSAYDALSLVASDWITRNMTRYSPAVEVVPTVSMLAYEQSARLRRFDLFERSRGFAHGTGAQTVVWGSFYRTRDSLRFNVEISDLRNSLMVGSIPQITTHADSPMIAVDQLRTHVIRALVRSRPPEPWRGRRVPAFPAYEAFVKGLRAHVYRNYDTAAAQFEASNQADTAEALPSWAWWSEALIRSRQFARADTVLRRAAPPIQMRADYTRAARSGAYLRGDTYSVYASSAQLSDLNAADDVAGYETALAALAMKWPREARRRFSEIQPMQGAVHGRPEYFLHYAAAYHIAQSHRAELSIVRRGLKTRPRTIAVRLANCRVRAGLQSHEDAGHALNALLARDTDTTGTLTLGYALEDCAAELDAHGLADLAKRAWQAADAWHRARPRAPAIVPDTGVERGHIRLGEARDHARRGELGPALNAIGEAINRGLPFYEPGRVMLHADTSFRRLRNTRGFLRINQPRG